jgi:hypothetical protein
MRSKWLIDRLPDLSMQTLQQSWNQSLIFWYSGVGGMKEKAVLNKALFKSLETYGIQEWGCHKEVVTKLRIILCESMVSWILFLKDLKLKN